MCVPLQHLFFVSLNVIFSQSVHKHFSESGQKFGEMCFDAVAILYNEICGTFVCHDGTFSSSRQRFSAAAVRASCAILSFTVATYRREKLSRSLVHDGVFRPIWSYHAVVCPFLCLFLICVHHA